MLDRLAVASGLERPIPRGGSLGACHRCVGCIRELSSRGHGMANSDWLLSPLNYDVKGCKHWIIAYDGARKFNAVILA